MNSELDKLSLQKIYQSGFSEARNKGGQDLQAEARRREMLKVVVADFKRMRYLAARCSRDAKTAFVACHGAVKVQARPNRAVGAACVYATAAVLTKPRILTPLLKAYHFSVFHGVDGCHNGPRAPYM